jgi:ABC-type transporter Mla maintaining outer membrane lipid asymmetry permease subunit MlaE
VGIRFMFGKVLGIASVRYFVVPSVIKVVVSLFILYIIVKK